MMNSPTVEVIVVLPWQLDRERLKPVAPPVLPTSLIVAQIAEAVFGLIRAWLFKDTQVSAGQVAESLHRSACELRKAYIALGEGTQGSCDNGHRYLGTMTTDLE